MSWEIHIEWQGQTWLVGRLRLKGATLNAYASAFEHELMDEARSLLGK
jgi:hypothetical protein